MSPGALRRKYLPRNTTNITRAHPAAAAAAAAQTQHPPAPHKAKEGPTLFGTSNRPSRMTPFKKGFEMDTERQLAQAFKRPPRLFKEDTPFYPWLPRPVPLVNFHLNFKF
nr:MAG: hypothetical protein [Gammatorquevirus sp.]